MKNYELYYATENTFEPTRHDYYDKTFNVNTLGEPIVKIETEANSMIEAMNNGLKEMQQYVTEKSKVNNFIFIGMKLPTDEVNQPFEDRFLNDYYNKFIDYSIAKKNYESVNVIKALNIAKGINVKSLLEDLKTDYQNKEAVVKSIKPILFTEKFSQIYLESIKKQKNSPYRFDFGALTEYRLAEDIKKILEDKGEKKVASLLNGLLVQNNGKNYDEVTDFLYFKKINNETVYRDDDLDIEIPHSEWYVDENFIIANALGEPFNKNLMEIQNNFFSYMENEDFNSLRKLVKENDPRLFLSYLDKLINNELFLESKDIIDNFYKIKISNDSTCNFITREVAIKLPMRMDNINKYNKFYNSNFNIFTAKSCEFNSKRNVYTNQVIVLKAPIDLTNQECIKQMSKAHIRADELLCYVLNEKENLQNNEIEVQGILLATGENKTFLKSDTLGILRIDLLPKWAGIKIDEIEMNHNIAHQNPAMDLNM